MVNSPVAEGNTEGKQSTDSESGPFDKILKAAEKYDQALVKGWRDDIETLLVFAGLFSGVVTSFLIDSYHKLEEDPEDKMVVLLEQLVSFQRDPSLALVTDPISPFQPDASMIRINCFWFLSLTFSITSALYGLLCKQWIREFDRDTPTSTAAESLALRQLRRDSFEKWQVPAFMAALPILLEIAVILFFVGILDLLWGLHRTPFIVTMTVVAVSAVVYFTTTLLPALTIPKDLKTDIEHRRFERLSYQFICPYKSPQAWVFYRAMCKLLYLLSKLSESTTYLGWIYGKLAPALSEHIESPASDWSSFDLRVIRQYDQHVKDKNQELFSLQVYQLRAFEWALTMFRDSPSKIPHLQNVLAKIAESVAMSAVLGQWNVALWSNVSKEDVNLALKEPNSFWEKQPAFIRSAPSPTILHPTALWQREAINLLFYQQYAMVRINKTDLNAGARSEEVCQSQTAPSEPIECHKPSDKASKPKNVGLHFIIPFSKFDTLWSYPDNGVRQQSPAFLKIYEEAWETCSRVENDCGDRHLRERVAFSCVLAKHLNRAHDHTSILITNDQGQKFIKVVHDGIITQQLYKQPLFERSEWTRAIEKMQNENKGKLPPDYFASLPEHDNRLPDSQHDNEAAESSGSGIQSRQQNTNSAHNVSAQKSRSADGRSIPRLNDIESNAGADNPGQSSTPIPFWQGIYKAVRRWWPFGLHSDSASSSSGLQQSDTEDKGLSNSSPKATPVATSTGGPPLLVGKMARQDHAPAAPSQASRNAHPPPDSNEQGSGSAHAPGTRLDAGNPSDSESANIAAPGKEHTISEGSPSLAVDPGVNPPRNPLVARTKEQDTHSSRGTTEETRVS
ncbi:hypothetical protein VNI00_008013 [Paramarasmius palmivorus]|uniref:DUF6535 domain-containing protein n=1 Tax=Paramarasmius palmivorus TaxID=297713 RepID=A0AAW0CV05_9AGAR